MTFSPFQDIRFDSKKRHRTIFVMVLFLDHIPEKSRYYTKTSNSHALFYNFLHLVNQILVSYQACVVFFN